MDPDAALRELLDAVMANDAELVEVLVQALQHWLNRGGFPPQTLGSQELGADWHRTMTNCVCNLATGQVQSRSAGQNEKSSHAAR